MNTTEENKSNVIVGIKGMSGKELEHRFNEAVRLEKEKCRVKGVPTCEFDTDLKKAYLLYPDGRKEY